MWCTYMRRFAYIISVSLYRYWCIWGFNFHNIWWITISISDLVTHSRLIRSLEIIFPDWFRIVYNLISQNSMAFAMSKHRHYVTIMSEFCGRRYPSFLLMVTWPVDSNTKRGVQGSYFQRIVFTRLADTSRLKSIAIHHPSRAGTDIFRGN